MATATPQTDSLSVKPSSIGGRDEMNLAEWPIALVADRAPEGQKTIRFEGDNGRRVTVTSTDEYGLPTAIDTDVILALIYLTKIRNNFENAKVYFSKYELINLLNWPHESYYYNRLELALNKWAGVLLVYKKSWWNNRLKRYTNASMHIIESFECINGGSRRTSHPEGQHELPLSSFEWNKKFIESCQANNLRELDLDEYFSLKSPVTKRLYRFLGKRFYNQRDHRFDLHEIAFERVGLSRNYQHNAARIKEKLQPAIEELEAIGFLRPLSKDKRYKRIDRGLWEILLIRGTRAKTQASLPGDDEDGQVAEDPMQPPGLANVQHPGNQQVAPPDADPETPTLATELIKRGITAKTAVELVAQHLPEKIEQKIEFLDWRLTQPKPPKQPAGWLVKAITEDYTPPKDFVPQAERDRQAEAKRQAERQAAADRRQQHAEENRQQDRRREADARWSKLTPTAQAELEAKALAAASEDIRNTYLSLKRQGMGDGLLTGLRREYILTLIDADQQVEPA
jgi:hypothetical protein